MIMMLLLFGDNVDVHVILVAVVVNDDDDDDLSNKIYKITDQEKKEMREYKRER